MDARSADRAFRRIAAFRHTGYFYADTKPPPRYPEAMRLRYIVIPIALLALAGAAVYLVKPGLYRDAARMMHAHGAVKKETSRSLLENTIVERLKELEIKDSAVSITHAAPDTLDEIRAAIPRGRPIEVVLLRLSSAAESTSYHVDDCYCPADGRQCFIRFASPLPDEPPVLLTVTRAAHFLSTSAKIAVVLTDFGAADEKIASAYLSFPEPLTIGLAPTRASATAAKRIAEQYHKEIIALLPMEPLRRPGDDYLRTKIMIHYPDDRIQSIMHTVMKAVPGFTGFSNWGGGRVLEDSRATGIVFAEIKRCRAYFLEQNAGRKSVAASLARGLGLPFGKVDRSLDTVAGAARLREALVKCGRAALKRGGAIVACRPSAEFLEALERERAAFRQDGIRFVYVSEMLTAAADTTE